MRPSAGPARDSASDPIARQLLAGRYEILALIGTGGMGSVYRVRDTELSEVVALKMVRRELIPIPEILERFRLEVRLARRVTHRNVARVFDIGEHQGEKFLTMEFIDGQSLADALDCERRTGGGGLGVQRALEVVESLCAGLASAHAAGVVHRDLKPDNVLLAKDGRVVITDFGIARAFQDIGIAQTAGVMVGTPAYMAPEQVEGGADIDARADIYALGALLYELFTGQMPWSGDTPFAIAAARLTAPPPDPRQKLPELPRACADLVMRCMARRPEDRFASASEVASALSVITLPAVPSVSDPRSAIHLPVAVRVAGPEPILAKAHDKTVAVLPFRNAGPSEDEYLAEGLTDDLIDRLSMTRGLKVRSRSAGLSWKGMEPDAREVGDKLGVQVIVEGSVRRARGNVRISARLTSVADGFQLWARRFDRPEQDVLSINDEVANAIAEALTADAEGQTREARASSEAVDLYLRARYEYRKDRNLTRAIALFEQAEALAAGDPMILAGKAMAMARHAFFTGEGLSLALAVARQTVALAPTFAEARHVLGATLLQAGDFRGATLEFRQAIARSPGFAEAHGALGRILAEAGDLLLGIRFLETAHTLDPYAQLHSIALARSHALLGDWERCNAVCDAVDALGADTVPWVRFLMWRRDLAGAEALLASLVARGGSASRWMTVLRIMVGDKMPERFSVMPEGSPGPGSGDPRRRAFLLQLEAEAAAFFGDYDRALAQVRGSAEVGLIDIAWMDLCPLLAPLRQDPQFSLIREPVARRAQEILEGYRSP
jgi:serine/threonine protein kinase/tetratricopeptide (TPR) repeat protein